MAQYRWNKNRIGNPARPSWSAHSGDIMELLGLRRGGHLPVEGMEPRYIQNIKVWVTPVSLVTTFRNAAGIKHKSSKHRVMAECPQCARQMSVGRLFQHVCTGTKRELLDIRKL
jgi:hypothetical protein